MSRRNSARRRRSYGRRQHELRERQWEEIPRWSSDDQLGADDAHPTTVVRRQANAIHQPPYGPEEASP